MSSGGFNNVGGLTIEGFDTGIRYFSAEESDEYVPSTDVRAIQNCKTAIEVGNGSETANIKVDCAFGMYMQKTQYMWAPMSSLRDNSCDVKFYNITGNVLTIVGASESFADKGIHSLHLDLQNKSTMDGVININNISGCPDNWITLTLDNTSDGNIANAFTITGSDTISDVISKFSVAASGYSLVQGSDEKHITIKKD